jgi:polysaccharide deacetylase/baseplate protein BppL/uncharacterized protein DUF5907
MARLPTPGKDEGTWGSILNDFLDVEHNADGSLKLRTDPALTGKAQDSAVVHNSGAETIAGTKTFQAPPVLPAPILGSHGATKTYVDSTVAAGAPDASPTTKGIVQLTGDLGGTATAPTVPGLAAKAPTSRQILSGTGLSGGGDLTADRTLSVTYGATAGTAAQGNDTRLAAAATAVQSVNGKTGTSVTLNASDVGAPTTLAADSDVVIASPADTQVLAYESASSKWKNKTAPTAPVSSVAGKTGAVTLVKADVGLSSIDNTSDANKPVSIATQTALNAKYTKPGTGIPATDLDTNTQTQLSQAASAYQKPPSGIPQTDLTTTVQTSLSKADTALQPTGNLAGLTDLPASRTNLGLGDTATKNVGTTTGTIAAGDDSRFTAADQAVSAIMPILRPPKFANASSIVSLLQAGHGWVGSSGFTANDTTDFCMGTQSAKMTTPGDGGTYKIEKTGLSLDLTSKQLRLRVKLDTTAHIFTLNFLAASDNYVNFYQWAITGTSTGSEIITAGDWVTVTLNVASATVTGTPNRAAITNIKLNTRDDAAGSVTSHLQSVEVVSEPASIFPNGVVSICFDDNWDSVWTLGKPKLDAVGLHAGIYVIDDLVGQSGRLTQAQMLLMQEQGWEISAHARTNADHTATYTGLTAAQLDADLRAQVASLRMQGFRGQGTAYPLGQYGQTTDGQSTLPFTRRYFSYARTISRRTMETFPAADLLRLRCQSAISTFSGGYTPSLISGASGDLDKAKTNHAWLILCFHKIVSSAPTATTEIAASDYNTIIDKIVSNGMDCLPIGDVLRYYG